ncbi:MAG: CHRD domain-containing protein, partial [Armatimonadota bacterium]|nr:CHRD domain-containing protein [Armatimonadota bacterium]
SAPPPQLRPGRFDGELASGVITAASLVGPLARQPLSALLERVRVGEAYVNVHTVAHPGGEIRGQILPR